MVLTAISALVLAVWIGIAATRLPPFHPPPRLATRGAPEVWPEVVAVVPARNEEVTIGAVIAAHGASDYRGVFSVVVVNDHSTDETVSRALGAATGNVEIIDAPSLPAGWTGKLWAVNSGLERAKAKAPDAKYVLLTDADIVLAPTTLSALVAQAEETDAALTSLMARLDARGVWGELLVPAFVYFFQKLYPFHVVNDPSAGIAAAAGGCMLVRRDALDAIGGVAAIRGKLIDDCALASAIKSSGRKIWIGIAKDEAVSLRDNRSLASIWSMVARSAFAQLNHSWLLLAGTIAGMIFTYLAAPLIALFFAFHQNAAALVFSAAAIGAMSLTYLPTARIYDLAPVKTLFLPIAAAFYTLMTVTSAVNHAKGRGGAWKGRTYPA